MVLAAGKKSRPVRTTEAADKGTDQRRSLKEALSQRARVPALAAPTVLGDVILPDPKDVRSTLSPRQRIYPDHQASPAEIVSVTIVPAELYGAVPPKAPRRAIAQQRPLRSISMLSSAFSALVAVGALVVGIAPQMNGVQEPLQAALTDGTARMYAYVSAKAGSVPQEQSAAEATAPRPTLASVATQTTDAEIVTLMPPAPVRDHEVSTAGTAPRPIVAETSQPTGFAHEPRMMLMSAALLTDTPAAITPREGTEHQVKAPLAAIWTTVIAREVVARKPAPLMPSSAPIAVIVKPVPAAVQKAAIPTPKTAPSNMPKLGVTSAATSVPAKTPAKLAATPQVGAAVRTETSLIGATSDNLRLASGSRRSLGVTQVENPSPRSTPPVHIATESNSWTQDIAAPRR